MTFMTWKGRRGTPDLSACVHESGHAVAMAILGIKFLFVCANREIECEWIDFDIPSEWLVLDRAPVNLRTAFNMPDRRTAGFVNFHPTKNFGTPEQAQSFALSMFMGPMAEAKFDKKGGEFCLRRSDDRDSARHELSRFLQKGKINATLKDVEAKARAMLRDRATWAAVLASAKALQAKGELSEAEVIKIVKAQGVKLGQELPEQGGA